MLSKYKKSIENNIRNITIVVALRNFILFTTVIILFFESLGLDFFQIMIIETIFALTVLIMEVPSGYLADKFGRKKIIIAGTFFSFVGMLNYSFATTFELFIISEILIGLGCSFISGADSALLYDSLIELKRENEYKKIEGRREAVRTTAIGLAALLSGFFAMVSFRYNFYITTIAAFLAFLISLKLTETKTCCSTSSTIKVKFSTILKETIKHKELMLMIIFSATIFGFSTAHYFMSQQFMNMVNTPIVIIGIIFATANFAVAYLSLIAHKIEAKIGLIKSMLLATFFVAISFFIFGTMPTIAGIIGVYTYQFARGIRTPIVKDFINKRTVSSRRATILSLDSFIGRGLFVLVAPIIGYLTILIGFENTSILFSIFLITGLGTIVILLKQKIDLEKNNSPGL
ncbi:MAG: MFS transporter [archaeon]|jgi:MFS family permease